MAEGIDRSNLLWYKDCIIYQVHVKSYYDSNGDGYGDFRGLTEKLDYIQSLGVDCIWLLPFYPSPLRDDGYDIADYEGVNPIYGNINDFQTFLDSAHRRGLRVITELVINHTSDQHPWFQLARRSPRGSVERDFYVWSDTDEKYRDARIIFVDYEKSNWTWDPVAQQYYWHRFFHHQPDLNFDNPAVFEHVARVMEHWLDMGVDGLRLDAIPYLVEREGTNCENLPDTHKVIKDLRARLDRKYKDRIFLAEANQWPQDVRAYFGNGDECQMAYHFPVMPRLYMAVHMEDRTPITEILRQTPPIPPNCQWAMFLRNHDELTLEMVTDEERAYMYKSYAPDPLMKINVGIRRRLAPLLEYSRPRIELMNSLLLSLLGTPILYYGDEIGMGENIHLPDRNGVRTPMQWTPDRNGGFSRAPIASLYSPPIMDPIAGYQSTNVEAQQADPSSLLNWMKSVIALRKKHKVFGRGSIDVLEPDNHKILAYIRKWKNESVLCVCNLSKYPQSFTLDLKDYAGKAPVEMFGLAKFHPITTEPYQLVLGPYSFYWLLLEYEPETLPTPVDAAGEQAQPAQGTAAQTGPTQTAGAQPAWGKLMDGATRGLIESKLLPGYLIRQRWFAHKNERLTKTSIVDWSTIPGSEPESIIALVQVETAGGETATYATYLAIAGGAAADGIREKYPDAVVGDLNEESIQCMIHDALVNDRFCQSLLEVILNHNAIPMQSGTALGAQTRSCLRLIDQSVPADVRHVSSEQSNSSVVFGNAVILKLYRRLFAGANPDYELGLYLTEHTEFRNTPDVAGCIEYTTDGDNEKRMTLALLQQFVPNQGDGWKYTTQAFRQIYQQVSAEPNVQPDVSPAQRALKDLIRQPIPEPVAKIFGDYLNQSLTLGKRTAEMHVALAKNSTNPRFAPVNSTIEYLTHYAEDVKHLIDETLISLSESTTLDPRLAYLVKELRGYRGQLLESCDRLISFAGRLKRIRCHGDYHLGQVLDAGGDWIIFDFEGEPARPIQSRVGKMSPLKDVAGMLRSFGYAAYASLFDSAGGDLGEAHRLQPWAEVLETWSSVAFLKGYLPVIAGHDLVPGSPDEFFAALTPFLIDKAFYEINYELNNRPSWLVIPIISVVQQMRGRPASKGARNVR